MLSDIGVFRDVGLQVDGMQREKREECKVTLSVAQAKGAWCQAH